jgi:TRAP transporter 4TM/12TM fusion protein
MPVDVLPVTQPVISLAVARLKRVASIVGVAISLSAIYAAGFGIFSPNEHNAIAMMAGLLIVVATQPLIFLYKPKNGVTRAAFWAIDAVLAGFAILGTWRYMVVQNELNGGFYDLSNFDIACGYLGMIALIEFCRRSWGLPLACVGLISIAYVFFGENLPGMFAHAGFGIVEFIDSIWYNYSGVFGNTTTIVLGLVWVYIIFGVLLEATGAGRALLRISLFLTERTRGGPAYAAIVASSLFGTMSGSTVANVVGTGTFTIPLIKQRGFKPEFAAGIEATASSGGQIVPPIMGAAAFLMSELTGIPYLQIALAALVPAFFYYVSLFINVGLEARKQGIEPLPVEQRVVLTWRDAIDALMFVIPITFIIATLISGRSPAYAGFLGILSALATGFLNPEFRRNPFQLLRQLGVAGKSCGKLMVAIGVIGVIIGVMNLSGVGLNFASLILDFSKDSLFLALVFSMLGALALGMGMPTLPAYLIIVLIMGPAISNFGIPLLVAHMFVFYYGVASSLTPPVALAAYAAAPIAEASPLKTAVMAVKLGAAKFIIPFVFAYYPGMLLADFFDLNTFIWATTRLFFVIFLVSSVVSAFDIRRLSIWECALRLAASVAILVTTPAFQIGGLLVGAALVAFSFIRSRASEAPART